MPRLKLTSSNYYSTEANMEYMSASQYKAFRRCEAAAMAELNGEWHRESSTALLVGSYVDAYFSGEMDSFRAEHPEILKRDGTLKAEYVQADTICQRLAADPLAAMLLAGKHQIIKTCKIGGVWFKCKMDSLLSSTQVEAICKRFPAVRKLVPFGGAMIVDLKCMRSFEPVWDDESRQRMPWIEYWGYDLQGAIYQKVDKRSVPFVIVGATKESTPDIGAFFVPDANLQDCIADVEAMAPRYAAIKRGEIEPARCGRCAYCRATKSLTDIIDYTQLEV